LIITIEGGHMEVHEGPDIKSHKIRSVAARSRRVMLILGKLFIRQLESNESYSIMQINDAIATRNGRWAP
jgi:hypothetical protein